MKKTLTFTLGALVGGLIVIGYKKFSKTERGERIENWAKNKARKQINNLVNKIDKVTTETTSVEEAVTE